MNIDVSFVLPCLNEEKTLAQSIELCKEAISKLDTTCEIVIADNGSTDNSIQIANSYGVRIVNVKHKGYGSALIHGINASQGKYIVMGDADATYDFREAVKFINCIKSNQADLVIGSRLKGKIAPKAMPFLHRYLGTPVLSFLINLFFGLHISDCNCGMRAFTREAFIKMNMISSGMEFASEMLVKAGILKLRVKELECSLAKDTRGRPPHLKTWRDGWRHLKFILAFAPKYVFFYPGIVSMILGIILTAGVSFGRVFIDDISLDYNFMYVGALFIFSGYQLIWLSKFERYYVKFIGYFSQIETPKFCFDCYARASLILLIIGIIFAVISVINWSHGFYASGIIIRLMILSIDCILLGVLTFVNALIIGMMEVKNIKVDKL